MGPGASQERLAGLLARVAAGDGAGMAALYDETSPFIFGLLRQMLGAGAAEEALVEVYSCVWRKAASYRPGSVSVLAWLVSTARESVSGRGRPAAAGGPPHEPRQQSAEAATVEGGGETPHAFADAEAARAREAFRRLDPKQREALQLTYFHGPGPLEAALGLSAREARTLLIEGMRSYAKMFRGAPNG